MCSAKRGETTPQKNKTAICYTHITSVISIHESGNILPPKTTLFGEHTLGKATALRAAPAAAERGEVLRLTLARFLISCRKTRGKQQRSVSGLPLTRRRKVLCADIVRTLKWHFHSAPIFNGGVSPQTSEKQKGRYGIQPYPPFPFCFSLKTYTSACVRLPPPLRLYRSFLLRSASQKSPAS